MFLTIKTTIWKSKAGSCLTILITIAGLLSAAWPDGR
jgi:hypothetical protein